MIHSATCDSHAAWSLTHSDCDCPRSAAPLFWSMYQFAPDFSWDFFCGPEGSTVLCSAREYDFERVHPFRIKSFWADLALWSSIHSFPLAVHYVRSHNHLTSCAICLAPTSIQQYLPYRIVAIIAGLLCAG